ncbi:MAG: two-component regulator propeller domain-containing protein, partial [Blastocatellia bacterium]
FELSAIDEDKEGRIFLGLRQGLVTYDEKGKKWTFYDLDALLELDNNVTAIVTDRAGRIWISAGLGILALED